MSHIPVPDRYDNLSEEAIVAHDRQRDMPKDALHALITELGSRVGGGTCLDAGTGTGAIAVPLAAAGTPVVGLDVSRSMLGKLRGRLTDVSRVPIVRGDVTHLPFADGTFTAVHCARTLHLIADWRAALAELYRVTAPEGLLLFGLGGGLSSIPMLQDVQWTFQQALAIILGDTPSGVPGPADEEEVIEGMRSLGAAPLPSIELKYDHAMSIDKYLHRLEHNVFGRSDTMDQEVIRGAADRTRAWAVDQVGSLEHPLSRQRTLTYQVYRKPSR